jgi:hypothetical protein
MYYLYIRFLGKAQIGLQKEANLNMVKMVYNYPKLALVKLPYEYTPIILNQAIQVVIAVKT